MSSQICNFFDAVKIVPIASYASANSDRNSEVLDTLGAAAVRIIIHHATIAAGSVMNAYLTHADAASDETTLTSGADVLGSSQAVADDDDNTVHYIDFIPTKRFYQLVFNKDATNVAAESAIALLYMKNRPVTHAGGTSGIGDGTGAVVGEFLGSVSTGDE